MIVQPIGFINTAAPLVALAAGAIILPRVFLDRETMSHRVVGRGILLSGAVLTVLGAAILAVIYQLRGSDVAGAFATDRVATLGALFKVSLKLALFWAPVLALVWFSWAQGVERRRGEHQARR